VRKTKTQIEAELADELIRSHSPTLPHIAEVTEQIIARFGGAAEFADAWYMNFKASDSQATRGRMLDSVMRLLMISGNTSSMGNPLSGMSTAELTAVASDLVRKANGQTQEGQETAGGSNAADSAWGCQTDSGAAETTAETDPGSSEAGAGGGI
jgi:hypothetical protein